MIPCTIPKLRTATLALLLGLPGLAPCAAEPASGSLPADGDYYILAKHSYKPLTALDTGGVAQYAWSPRLEGGQVWTLKKEGAGYSVFSGKYKRYLAVEDKSKEAGSLAVTAADNAGRQQRWQLRPRLDAFSVVAGHSRYALDVSGSSRAEGAPVIQWDETSSSENQQFLLIPADGAQRGRHAFMADPLAGSSYDSTAKRYHLQALLSAVLDGQRMLQMSMMGYHPSGLYVAKGEKVRLEVSGLAPDRDALVLMVGQANSFFGSPTSSDPFERVARVGQNEFVAPRSGMLYFRYNDSGFGKAPPPAVDIQVLEGGNPVPFFIANQTTAAQWQDMLRTRRTPYVEMIAPRVAVTLRRDLLDRASRTTPDAMLGYLTRMIGYHDEVSGLDGSTPIDRPSPLRMHFLQDDRSSAKTVENVYMYATNSFVGMPADSAQDLLTDMTRSVPWALWHESGHIYQQSDWTWDNATEVTVNIYSLHAQQRFGLPSRLDSVDEGTGRNTWDEAARYLARKKRNFLDDASFAEDTQDFVRLVMFEQLRRGLGDSFYPKLHKDYRRNPLSYDEGADDDDKKVQQFILRSSRVAGRDLTGFFRAWGLPIDSATAAAISAMGLPPAADLTRVR
jgi:hypothetical protein